MFDFVRFGNNEFTINVSDNKKIKIIDNNGNRILGPISASEIDIRYRNMNANSILENIVAMQKEMPDKFSALFLGNLLCRKATTIDRAIFSDGSILEIKNLSDIIDRGLDVFGASGKFVITLTYPSIGYTKLYTAQGFDNYLEAKKVFDGICKYRQGVRTASLIKFAQPPTGEVGDQPLAPEYKSVPPLLKSDSDEALTNENEIIEPIIKDESEAQKDVEIPESRDIIDRSLEYDMDEDAWRVVVNFTVVKSFDSKDDAQIFLEGLMKSKAASVANDKNNLLVLFAKYKINGGKMDFGAYANKFRHYCRIKHYAGDSPINDYRRSVISQELADELDIPSDETIGAEEVGNEEVQDNIPVSFKETVVYNKDNKKWEAHFTGYIEKLFKSLSDALEFMSQPAETIMQDMIKRASLKILGADEKSYVSVGDIYSREMLAEALNQSKIKFSVYDDVGLIVANSDLPLVERIILSVLGAGHYDIMPLPKIIKM